MESRAGNIQFRSVPLIQRRDLAQLGGTHPSEFDAAMREDRSSARASGAPSTPQRRVGWLVEGGAAGSARTRAERGPSWDDAPPAPRTRELEDEQFRARSELRRARRAERQGRRGRTSADRTEPEKAERAPLTESVSAHMGESTVVGVSRRSERTRSAGLSLVPERPVPTYDPPRWEPSAPASDEARMPVWQRDEDVSWGFSDQRGRSSADAREARRSARTHVAREPLFADDERYDVRGISGSARRRDAVREGLLVVPRGIAALLGAAVQHMRLATTVAIVLLMGVMLFAPVRNLYVAHRQLDALQATYDALLADNEEIEHELEVLQSREGIENEARARGFVDVGETKVIVEGLPQEEARQEPTAASLSEVEVSDERPWHIQLLDTLFGYEPE